MNAHLIKLAYPVAIQPNPEIPFCVCKSQGLFGYVTYSQANTLEDAWKAKEEMAKAMIEVKGKFWGVPSAASLEIHETQWVICCQ